MTTSTTRCRQRVALAGGAACILVGIAGCSADDRAARPAATTSPSATAVAATTDPTIAVTATAPTRQPLPARPSAEAFATALAESFEGDNVARWSAIDDVLEASETMFVGRLGANSVRVPRESDGGRSGSSAAPAPRSGAATYLVRLEVETVMVDGTTYEAGDDVSLELAVPDGRTVAEIAATVPAGSSVLVAGRRRDGTRVEDERYEPFAQALIVESADDTYVAVDDRVPRGVFADRAAARLTSFDSVLRHVWGRSSWLRDDVVRSLGCRREPDVDLASDGSRTQMDLVYLGEHSGTCGRDLDGDAMFNDSFRPTAVLTVPTGRLALWMSARGRVDVDVRPLRRQMRLAVIDPRGRVEPAADRSYPITLPGRGCFAVTVHWVADGRDGLFTGLAESRADACPD
ncbi:MAG: hypothetical protein WKF45_03830 [Ilumatobacteraceae bacterium]